MIYWKTFFKPMETKNMGNVLYIFIIFVPLYVFINDVCQIIKYLLAYANISQSTVPASIFNIYYNLNEFLLAAAQFYSGSTYVTRLIWASRILVDLKFGTVYKILTMFKDSLEEELRIYAAAKEWKKVLKISELLSLKEKSKYLWTWPTEDALFNLKSTLHKLGVEKILSIGCGTGLLEWIIQESIGLSVYGLEVDRSWWESSYSPSSFIKLNFMENGCMESHFLQRCCDTNDWNFCLLFCYFNNGRAFQEYLRLYKGSTVVIIGPAPNVEIYTDPAPLSPEFPDSRWRLFNHFNISKDNIVAIYILS